MPDKEINKVTDELFALLRIGLWGGGDALSFSALGSDRWSEVYALAVRHGVLAVAWDGVRQLPADMRPPKPLMLQWGVNVERIEQRYRKQAAVISRLAAFYAAHDMKMMVLKGYSLSLFYPVPEHRAYGDIDIWLYGCRKEADKALAAEWGVQVDYGKEHHTTFVVDGVMIENHYDFMNTKDSLANVRTERLLKRYASLPGACRLVDGAEVQLPPVRFDALFLLRHAAVHFAAVNIELRHLVDWAAFVVGNRDKIDWQTLYADTEAIGMSRFLSCMNGLCIDRLGVDAALFGTFERDAELEQRVLNEMLQPCFDEAMPSGAISVVWFKIRRRWVGRWKHNLVSCDSFAGGFIRSTFGHFLKPRSIAGRKKNND